MFFNIFMKIHPTSVCLLSLLSFFSCTEMNEEELLNSFYPLDFCIVSGSDLGDMGEPVSYDHNGTIIKFCCKPCIPKFRRNPEKYLVLLREELDAINDSLEDNSS